MKTNKSKKKINLTPIRQHPEPKGCCHNPNWVAGFLYDFCKTCGENNY